MHFVAMRQVVKPESWMEMTPDNVQACRAKGYFRYCVHEQRAFHRGQDINNMGGSGSCITLLPSWGYGAQQRWPPLCCLSNLGQSLSATGGIPLRRLRRFRNNLTTFSLQHLVESGRFSLLRQVLSWQEQVQTLIDMGVRAVLSTMNVMC